MSSAKQWSSACHESAIRILTSPDKSWADALWTGSFAVLLFFSLLTVLSCRIFPSQDGPLHLYYAEVTRNLLLGTGRYESGFLISHLLTPYILQTYVLAALNEIADPLLSERLLVCAYVATFCLGFRYLVHSLIPRNQVLPLFAFFFAFNCPLYMGYYNFCLGMAFSLWITGYWLRYWNLLNWRRTVTLAVLITLVAITHPVAVLFCLMFLDLHLATQLIGQSRIANTPLTRGLAQALRKNARPTLHVIAAHSTVFWIMRFTTNNHDLKVETTDIVERLKGHLLMWTVSPMQTRYWRWTLMVVVALAVAAIGWHLVRRLSVSPNTFSLLAMSTLCLVFSLVSPPKLGGGTNIAQRFACYGFILLVTASAAARVRESLLRAVGSAAVVVVPMLLLFLWQANQRAVLALEPFLDVPPVAAESKMIWLVDLKARMSVGLNCNLGYWIAANYARRSEAILENYGWLYLSYMNLSPRLHSACTFEEPADMESCLQAQANNRARPDIDIMLTEGVPTPAVASLYGLHPLPVGRLSPDSVFHFFARSPVASNEQKGRLASFR